MSTDRTDQTRRLRDVSGTHEHRHAIRRLCRNGNSTTISVPPEFLASMNTLPGAFVELVFDHEWQGFFVRVYVEPHVAPTPTPPLSEVSHGA